MAKQNKAKTANKAVKKAAKKPAKKAPAKKAAKKAASRKPAAPSQSTLADDLAAIRRRRSG